MTQFALNDIVEIIPHSSTNDDGTPKPCLGRVTNPYEPTDRLRLDGTPVGHYVLVAVFPSLGIGRYHEASLRKVQS